MNEAYWEEYKVSVDLLSGLFTINAVSVEVDVASGEVRVVSDEVRVVSDEARVVSGEARVVSNDDGSRLSASWVHWECRVVSKESGLILSSSSPSSPARTNALARFSPLVKHNYHYVQEN